MTDTTIYVQQGGAEGYWIAHVPAIPGCNASGTTRDDAIANARRAFRAYRELLDARGVSVERWKGMDPDTFAVADAPAGGLLPGEDAPLEEHELRDFLHQFEASHAALIALVQGLSTDDIERRLTETEWSVRHTLEHLLEGNVDFLARLEKWPKDPFNAYQAVHRLIFQRFAVMEPGDWTDHTVLGRRWTTRRVMRRLLEHQLEHYEQIKAIIAGLGSAQRPPE